MITLSINLPERFDLVSIQRMYNGRWAVCVKIVKPGEYLGLVYALGEHDTVPEAAKLAVERCLYKESHPDEFGKAKPTPKVDLDLKELGL